MVEQSFYSILSGAFHNVSQILLIPVIVILLIFVIYAVISLGGLLFEYNNRRKTRTDFKEIESIMLAIKNSQDPEKIIKMIKDCKMPIHHKKIIIKLTETSDMDPEWREAFAQKILENEEFEAAKRLEKTEIIAKIGPAIGLMGTLIPLGPGLAALGAGDIQNLAQHLTVAFDAAILGMASTALGFTISKLRRRWYEEDISSLDTLAESVLEVLKS